MFEIDNIIIKGKVFKPFITQEKIEECVRNLAYRINEDYKDSKPQFLIILKGAIFFASDLLRKIKLDCDIETIRVKSYGNEMISSGNVEIYDNDLNILGRDVLIVEDIVDTGLTIKHLIKKLMTFSPNSIELVSLLSKPSMRKCDINIKYLGMEIPPVFVIGYGLDYSEHGRQLPSIYGIVNDSHD